MKASSFIKSKTLLKLLKTINLLKLWMFAQLELFIKLSAIDERFEAFEAYLVYHPYFLNINKILHYLDILFSLQKQSSW